MLRSLQASFRQLRGLNIEDRLYKIWIKYFTVKTTKLLTSLPKNHPLNAHYSNFNFTDVNEKMLYAEGDSVEANPADSLPVLFNFQQPISKHYFEFCKILEKEKNKIKDYRIIVFETHPHLLRCFIAFTFQIQNNVENFINKRDSAFFPLSFIEDLPYLISILLTTPPEIRSEFLFLFSYLMRFINEHLSVIVSKSQKSNQFSKSMYQIFTILLDFFKKEESDCDDAAPALSFVVLYFYETFNFDNNSDIINKTFPDFCITLSKNSKLRGLLTPVSYGKIFELTSLLLFHISLFNVDVERKKYIDAVLPILQMLITLMPIKRGYIPKGIGDNGIMSPIVKFVEWVSKTELPEEIPIPKIENDPKYANMPHAETFYEFIDENLIDESVYDVQIHKDVKNISTIQPTYLQNSPGIISLLFKITTMCSKDNTVLSDFITTISKSFTETHSLTIQYIGTFSLFTTQSIAFAQLMDKTNSWQYFVTPTIFNRYTVSGNCSEHLINLKNMVLSFATIAFTSKYEEETSLLEAFGNLMCAEEPALVEAITSFFNKLIKLEYNRFLKCIVKTNIIDKLFSINIQYREQSKKDPTDKLLISARTQIAIFIRELMDTEKPCQYIYQSNLRSNTIIALAFEKKTYQTSIDIITLCISTLKTGDFLKHLSFTMRIGLKNATDPKWTKFFSDLIDKFIYAHKYNYAALTNLFVDTGCLTTFCTISAAYVDADKKEEATMFIKKVLKLIILMCKKSPTFQESLSSPTANVRGNIEKTLKYITIDDTTVNLLLSLATNNEVTMSTAAKSGEIICAEGLSLLYLAVEGTKYLDVIIDFLTQITENSVSNRYQCFRANIIQSLLKLIPQNAAEKTMQLFSQLGASFLRLGELSLTIRLLKNADKEYALPLLRSLIKMTDVNNHLAPKSFFHIGQEDQVFNIQSFQVDKYFTISSLFNFESDSLERSQRPIPFMNIVGKGQRIDFMLLNRNIVVSIKDIKRNYEFQLFDDISPNIWYSFSIAFEPKHIYAYSNRKLVKEFEIENRFKFNDSVTISICGAKINVEQISIYNTTLTPPIMSILSMEDEASNKKLQQVAFYSANRYLNGRCINQITSNEIGAASFNGLVVPFTISLVDAIPTCGGPNILLPLLELTTESPDPSQSLLQVLTLIERVSKYNQQIFVGQRFFRSLGHLLLTLKKEIVTEEVIDELYVTYRELTITSLKREMIRYVWGDFAIWTHMTEEIQLFVFTGVLTGLVQTDAKIVSEVIPFREFLKRFTTMFADEDSNTALLNRCWNFLLLLAQQYFTIEDANALITTVISTQDEKISMASIELMRNLLTENSQAIVNFIRERKFFSPFTQLVNAQNEKLRLYGVHMMYYIQVKADYFKLTDDLCDEMINVIRLYFHSDQTAISVNLVLGYMFGLPDHTMKPPTNYTFDYNYKGTIKYPQFLPLLMSLLTYVEKDERQKISTLIKNSFNDSYESCVEMSKCSNWQFWILFFSFLDNKLYEWQPIIAKIFLAKVKTTPSYDPTVDLTYVHLIGKATNINSTQIIRAMLTEVMEANPTLPCLYFSLRFIFYVDYDDYDLLVINRVKIPPVPSIDVIQSYAQKIIMMKLDLNDKIVYTRQSQDDPWPDFSLAIRCVKYIVSLDPKIFAQTIAMTQDFNISHAAICSLLITYINHQSSPDSDLLIKPFIDQCMKLNAKEQLANPIIALLDIYSYECEESRSLINLLHISDKFYETTTIDVVNDISDGVVQSYTNDIKGTFEAFSKTRNSIIKQVKAKLEEQFEFFFTERQDENLLYDLKHSYKLAVKDMEKENARIIRGNAKFWMGMMKEMHNQVGGPWALDVEEMTHFMFSNSLDLIGRRLKTKINHNFTLHADASSLRDNSLEEPTEQKEKTIYVENQGPTDTDEPNNRLNTLQIDCRLITATLFIKGTLFLGNNLVAFESSSATNSVGQDVKVQKIIEIGIDQVSFILKRRYLHIDNSAELFTLQNKSYFFTFQNENTRMKFMKQVKAMKPQNLKFIQFKDAIKFYHEMNLQKRWMSGEVSNFEYIMWLNILAGRSIHDLSQYPVFPWILSDYNSEKIDLSDPKVYRDLSKPIGALNEERLENLLVLYNETKGEDFASIYRFHYSTPAYVIGYLIRMEPFTSLHIALQSGKFDHPNRLFFSLPYAWKSCVSKHPDFRELSPEFFSTPDFLYNFNKFDLGILDDKVTRVDDVELPKWAHNPAEFVAINRLALESKYASEHINQWIDLIFGFSSRGINAEKTNNVFHPYSYSSSVTKEVLDDPLSLSLIQQHAANFGIVPDQLFQQPHPQRKFTPSPHKFMSNKMCFFEAQQICRLTKKVLRFTPGNDNTIWILYSSGEYVQYSLEDMSTQLTQEFVPLSIPSDLATNDFFRRHLTLLESKKQIFFTSPLSTGFRLLHVDDKRCKVVYSESAHAVSITAATAESYGREYYAVTASGDSSILAWDLVKCCQTCKIVAHTFSIVDVDISVLLGMVASIDTSGMLVMSSLTNGSYIHSVKFDSAPTNVRIAPLGFVVLLFEQHQESSSSTKIVVVDIGGRVIATTTIEGSATAICMIELKDASCYIAVATDTKFITVVNIYDLEVKSRGCIMDIVEEIEYSKEDERLLLLTRNGDLLKYEIVE